MARPERSEDFTERAFSAQDGLRLSYRDYGDPLAPGRPVLCLSGLSRNAKDFAAPARHLAKTRRVVCLDYRGRGRSAYDPDWHNYRPEVLLRDVSNLLAAANLHGVVACGTSLGGLLAMGLAVMSPAVLAGAILNDVGPVVEQGGTERIFAYLRNFPPARDWDAAVATVKSIFAELGYERDSQWRQLAEATYRQAPDGTLVADWDPNLVKGVERNDRRDLWPLFRALRHLPVLALRGENSSVLSAETFARMLAEKPDLIQVTVPGVGHAPGLDEPIAEQAIDDFLAGLDG